MVNFSSNNYNLQGSTAPGTFGKKQLKGTQFQISDMKAFFALFPHPPKGEVKISEYGILLPEGATPKEKLIAKFLMKNFDRIHELTHPDDSQQQGTSRYITFQDIKTLSKRDGIPSFFGTSDLYLEKEDHLSADF